MCIRDSCRISNHWYPKHLSDEIKVNVIRSIFIHTKAAYLDIKQQWRFFIAEHKGAWQCFILVIPRIRTSIINANFLSLCSIPYDGKWNVSIRFEKNISISFIMHMIHWYRHIFPFHICRSMFFNTWFFKQCLPWLHMEPLQPTKQLPLHLPIFLSHLPGISQVRLHFSSQLYP